MVGVKGNLALRCRLSCVQPQYQRFQAGEQLDSTSKARCNLALACSECDDAMQLSPRLRIWRQSSLLLQAKVCGQRGSSPDQDALHFTVLAQGVDTG
jgi:hypothetical protein